MSYLGSSAAPLPVAFAGVNGQSFNGGTSTFTLSRSVSKTTDIELVVNNVQQNPYDGSYSVNGNVLTTAESVSAGVANVYVAYLDAPLGSFSPTPGSVVTSSLADDAVTNSKRTQGVQVFTSSGTFTVPINVTKVKVTVVGGGGSGNNGGSNNGGGGGGAGGCAIKWITGLTPGSSVSVTAGTGGASISNATAGTNGNAGGASSFGAYCSASGGGGAVSTLYTGGAGGAGTGGDINLTGGAGEGSQYNSSYANGAGGGGGGVFGGGGAGGGGGNYYNNQTNVSGATYGSGGAGGYGGSINSGAGASGVVIVEY
jgi:hypothetical protein